MLNIEYLPNEIVHKILVRCDPVEVSKVAQCSRSLRTIVYNSGDSALWRDLYLEQPFDDPRLCLSQDGAPRPEVDWRLELQHIIRARTVITTFKQKETNHIPDDYIAVLQTLVDMMRYVRPLKGCHDSHSTSESLIWVAALLSRYGFIDHATQWGMSDEGTQLLSRVHTYYGLTKNDFLQREQLASRAFVYDMRNYHAGNEYGPLDERGGVNWVHIRALHHVVSMHIMNVDHDESNEFQFLFFPLSSPYSQIMMPEGSEEDEDWAGIAGPWTVSFCYCDHRELLSYNRFVLEEYPSGPVSMDRLRMSPYQFREAFRSLNVVLEITRTEPDPGHPKHPVLHFSGEMTTSVTSTMSGHVKMISDGQVKWYFQSGELGNVIWSSVGIQIGGLRSSCGILGAWTTIFHDRDDPIGPFWLTKDNSAIPHPSSDHGHGGHTH